MKVVIAAKIGKNSEMFKLLVGGGNKIQARHRSMVSLSFEEE